MHENYYEETLDHDLVKLLSPQLRVEKVKAFNVGNVRLIGDIGLRAFFQLYRKAKRLIRTESFDFLYIPIPSFYCALLGRWLQSSTGIKYGIDYIDPWVHHFPGAEKKFSRHWWSMKLSGFLEPIAVKKASLITGVAEGYYRGVVERNPYLSNKCILGAMPYGGEADDYKLVGKMDLKPYLFEKKQDVVQLVYAGAMLPKAYDPLERIFIAISENKKLFDNIEFHFIGTGKSPNDTEGYNIKPKAEQYGLWQEQIFEYPARLPYLDVLVHLEAADGVFILGSTEPHYTPSKLYQAVLSRKPVLAVLHEKSEAFGLVDKAGAGITIGITEQNVNSMHESFAAAFEEFLSLRKSYSPQTVNVTELESYSAFNVTGKLASLLDHF